MTTTETAELKAKFATLVPSLDDLETLLRPLLQRPLSDSLADLDKIQQAKLYALIPYLVYDLAFSASLLIILHIYLTIHYKFISS
jgi:hypothetical protein